MKPNLICEGIFNPADNRGELKLTLTPLNFLHFTCPPMYDCMLAYWVACMYANLHTIPPDPKLDLDAQFYTFALYNLA